jgi:spectinomycin phosphotransferase
LFIFDVMENLPPSEKLISDCLKVNYGIDVEVLTPLSLGADVDAFLYKAEAYNHSQCFVKIKRGLQNNTCAIVMSLLRNAGIQHIIPIVKTLSGESNQLLGNFTVMVMPYIEGKDGFSRDLTDDQWILFGRVMREIHEIDVPPPIQSLIRRESFSPNARQFVRSLYDHIQSQPDRDEIAAIFSSFMIAQKVEILRIVDRAEQLSQEVQSQSLQFVLCHSDIHAGNVLLDEGGSLFIVDWDAPILAPKERDLMFVGGGVGNVWNRAREEELFYRGYGSVVVNRVAMAYYRYERIVHDIAEYGQLILLSMTGGDQRIEWYRHFIAQFDSQGVVDIAFKTDREK